MYSSLPPIVAYLISLVIKRIPFSKGRKIYLVYHVLWPGGNTTALVDVYVPFFLRRQYTQAILIQDREVEQVGFLEKSRRGDAAFHLAMMGGEFCGNAARCAGYLWVYSHQGDQVVFTVSGFPYLISYLHTPEPTIYLPSVFLKSLVRVDASEAIVDLYGIRHVVTQGEGDMDTAQDTIAQHQGDSLATGAIYFLKTDQGIQIDPYVCVRATHTCYHETACGSGSIAAALQVAHSLDDETITVVQPTGTPFRVRLDKKGGTIEGMYLSGIVTYTGAHNSLRN